MQRAATAVWIGNLKEGTGSASVKSGAFKDLPVTYQARFENDPGTNPEELIAAAHASCFSMALSAMLNNQGLTPRQIQTTATVTLTKTEDGFGITKTHLVVEAMVDDATEAQFQEAAHLAKAGCPVSKLLAPGLESLTMEARLVKP